MCDCDFDAPAFYSESFHVAMRNHVCSECERDILKKEKYKRSTGKWSSKSVDTFKTCLHCSYAQDFIYKNSDCQIMHGGLWEQVWDHLDDYPTIDIYRIRIGIQRKWKNKKGEIMKVPLLKGTKIEEKMGSL